MDENLISAIETRETRRIKEARAVEALRTACKAAGAAKWWAEAHGVAYSHVHRVLKGKGRPGPKIAAVLGLPRIPHQRYRKTRWNNFDNCYIPEPNSGCWLWEGTINPRRYGLLTVPGARKPIMAHREAYRRAYGSIPDGLSVLHRCDMPLCVNPEHLFLGTPADNTRDMIKKGRLRSVRGEAHVGAKLTKADVLAIRASSEKHPILAARYDVARATVGDIRNRRTWRHLP